MAGISGTLTASLVSRLGATADGVNARVSALQNATGSYTLAGIRAITPMNVSADVSEKAGQAQYPALLVYCDKMSNTLREKFRQFSGKAHLVVEVRHTQDLLEGLESATQTYVDAVCALLDDSRGAWDGGGFYSGGYEVSYEPITRGGKNFLQRAKVSFDVEVSK